MPIDRATAQSLAEKLASFAYTLAPEEQAGLIGLVDSARAAMSNAVTRPSAQDLLAPDADFSVIDEVNKALSQRKGPDGQIAPMSTPTIPITTIVTTVASHPIITCHGSGGHRSGGSAAATQLRAEIASQQVELAREQQYLRDHPGDVQTEERINQRITTINNLESQLSRLG